jgi:acyl-CoA reductase-like NAD-dependent aldehyde dehydrogenase
MSTYDISAPSSSDHLVPVDLRLVRGAQERWAAVPVDRRMRLFRAIRHGVAERALELAATVPPHLPGQLQRSAADTLASEVLPLAEACRFLERVVERLLAPVRESVRLRPLWLGGVSVETRREPLGIVLIIGPGNYPLFLPGAQALQALAAGNAVLWKPAPGGSSAARALRALMVDNGLDPLLLTVLDESAEAAYAAMDAGVDKVVLTGSAATGRAVMRRLADDLTPSVMELSGCDAVFVLAGADLDRVVEAVAFGLRFNGSFTCMAPRRLILSDSLADLMAPMLVKALRQASPVSVSYASRKLLSELVQEAVLLGAQVLLHGQPSGLDGNSGIGATLIDQGTPQMRAACTDIFAPSLTILRAGSEDAMLEAHRQCPYALTASVFGPEPKARAFASRIHAGTVLINDVLVSSADPRASFGGRGMSGFGATRGAAGLLEMSGIKSVIVQRSRSRRAWQPTTEVHAGLFAAFLRCMHGKGWLSRLKGLLALVKSARTQNS